MKSRHLQNISFELLDGVIALAFVNSFVTIVGESVRWDYAISRVYIWTPNLTDVAQFDVAPS
jgi:hypothetical protein